MKQLTEAAGRVEVNESTGQDESGREMSRTWTFVSVADAQLQAAEFAAELAAAPKALRDKFAAEAAKRGG